MDELPQKHLIPVEDHTETKKPKFTPLSDLTDDKQLMEKLFGEASRFRFELCKVRLIYETILEDLKLHGSIQASCFSPDPLLNNDFSDIFNRKFNNPLHLHIMGFQALHDIHRCSLPLSSTIPDVQIAAKLSITTDKVRDVETSADIDADDCADADCDAADVMDEATAALFRKNYKDLGKLSVNTSVNEVEATGEKPHKLINNEVFQVCDDYAFLDFSNKRDGFSDEKIIQGKDGSLELFYVALKYAVDADLEVEFVAPSKETQVYGSVVAYYGKNFKYRAPASAYHVTLFRNKRFASAVGTGKINLMRSVLAVPAKSSLIIEANLRDNTSGYIVFSGTCEITPRLDGKPSVGLITSKGYSLNVKVNWKLPSEELKIPSTPMHPPALASNSIVRRLAKRRKFGAHPTSSMADHSTSSTTVPDERSRWSLQEELENVFNASLERLSKPQEAVSCTISTCTKEDGGDYLCSGVMHIWPILRKTCLYKGPKRAGLAVKSIMDSEHTDMMESCVVCGPGFIKFKLSRKWIAEGIRKMLTAGIDTWAPKLSVKKTVIYFLSQTSGEQMHMGHLRSTFIGETLARMLEYSGVVVIRKRINDDYPLIGEHELNMIELLVERLSNEATGDFEELYNISRKFDEDAGFRERATFMQDSYVRLHMARKIIGQRDQTLYQRLGVKVKEEDKSSYDTHCRDTLTLMMEKGLPRGSEGDMAVPEGPDSPLVYLTTLRHALEVEKADWILHVSDEGKRVSIEKCITGARLAELIGKDLSECPLSHVGFAQGDDFKHPEVVNFVNVLNEAKSHCKMLLARQGMADEWTDEEIEHAAEALGIGALKYADLRNNRLTNYTFSYDQMLNEKGDTAVYLQFTHVRICSIIKGFSKDIKKLKADELILKKDDEREFGLHLLRFTEVLEEVCTFLAPHILCKYVYDLCVKFDCLEASVPQVVGSSEETSYLLLCATEVVMRKCFDLLGIACICESRSSVLPSLHC